MGKPNLKIAGEPPERTPERQSLAEAIERHAKALDTVRRVSQAREGADESWTSFCLQRPQAATPSCRAYRGAAFGGGPLAG